jgi:hydroxymethylglutaryl-CoA reductase (NADPH)
MIPSFLLAKLYVKGSLKNNDGGFEFSLKNIIDSTMLIGIGPITVGEKNYEGEAITMTVADKSVNGAELSRSNSVPVRMGVPLKVVIAGEKLTTGAQKVSVSATTSDIGKIKFDISDTVA